MGILDGIVAWIAEQVMHGLDLICTSVLGALGCNMNTFLRYFPAAGTMYDIFVALAIGLILLNWVWQLFRNYGLAAGLEAEDPVKLSIRSVLFILLVYFSDDIVNAILKIGGTPYQWILSSSLPSLDFANFNSTITVILGVCASGAVAIIALILVLIMAWNYYHYLPVVTYDSHDVLQRFGKVKVEATSFTISEPYEPVVIAPLIYEQAEPDQQLILLQQFDVSPFEILTMTIERIFIDKLFAAEAYTRSAAQEHHAFEASKHIYDLAVISHEPRIVSFLQNKEQLTKLLTIRLTEEKNRLDGIPGVLPKDFTFFEKSCADTHIMKAYATMQNQYVFIPDDRIPLDEAQYRLHGLQDQLNQNPAWSLTAIPQ